MLASSASKRSRRRLLRRGALGLTLVALLAGCGASSGSDAANGKIIAVGAENEYANVIGQIGGRYVSVERDR